MKVYDFSCARCGKAFQALKPKRTYCSHKCAMTRDFTTRFWSKIEKTDECWYWKGSFNQKGYGYLLSNGKKILAHRIAYDLTHDEPLGDRFGCHSCDTPSCVRPDHIWPGTHAENMADSAKKGRQAYGEKHRDAKLTWAQVDEIRANYKIKDGRALEAALTYGVSRTTIYRVLQLKLWAPRNNGGQSR